MLYIDIYEIGGGTMDADPPAKPPTWKKSCAAILSQTVSIPKSCCSVVIASLYHFQYAALTAVVYFKHA